MQRLTFDKSKRIRFRRDFDRVFRRKCVAGDQHLVLHVADNDLSMPRLGIAAGKRLGNAVVRVREKRRLREAFRLLQYDLPLIDMVCVIKTVGQSVAEYQERLRRLSALAVKKLESRR